MLWIEFSNPTIVGSEYFSVAKLQEQDIKIPLWIWEKSFKGEWKNSLKKSIKTQTMEESK